MPVDAVSMIHNHEKKNKDGDLCREHIPSYPSVTETYKLFFISNFFFQQAHDHVFMFLGVFHI